MNFLKEKVINAVQKEIPNFPYKKELVYLILQKPIPDEDIVIKTLEKEASYIGKGKSRNEGNPPLSILGYLHFRGIYFDPNIQKGMDYFKKSSTFYSKLFLADLYYHGKYTERNYSLAERYYTETKDSGQSRYGLFCIYYYGLGKFSKDVNKALSHLIEGAAKYDPNSLYQLGLFKYKGLHVEKDEENALLLIRRSSMAGNNSATFFLAKFEFDSKNYEKALELIHLCLEQKGLKAYILLAIMHYHGLGNLEVDYGLARGYLEDNIKFNPPLVNLYLGAIYFKGGKNVEIDYTKARKHLLETGYHFLERDAMLYKIYKDGLEVEKNEEKAQKYLELSMIHTKSTNFLYEMGTTLLQGNEIEEEKGMELLEQAADEENIKAQRLLVKQYFKTKNFEKCRELCKDIIEKGDKTCFTTLGTIYLEGLGCEKDEETAIEYFELGMKHGDSSSIFQLGKFYLEGKFFEKDIAKAIEYFTTSANMNNPEANHLLGDFYLNGINVAQDKVKAAQHLEKAFTVGHLEAGSKLGVYYFNEKNFKRSKEIFEHNLSKNWVKNIGHLGDIYYKGLDGSEVDLKRAFECYSMGLKYRNHKCVNRLSEMYSKGVYVEKDLKKAQEIASLKFVQK